jgi:GTP-binding protein EngB required for normal cell division
MKQPEINTMILGQTGTGKSSLINYLYGADVVRTGAGKPVQTRGDFTKISVQSPFNPDVKINIFDSWGLESDKAEDWEAVIDAKLNAKLSFDEMVYAIVYCSSYANDGVLEFEIKMLKKLLSKQYKVTIALTKADNSGFETKKEIFRKKFAKELSEYQGYYSVVDICAYAEEKPKIGQSVASARTFGKEELFEELQKDFLVNFVNMVHVRLTDWKDESLAKIKDFHKRGIAVIEDFKGDLLDTNKERADKVLDRLNSEMQALIGDIQGEIKGFLEDSEAWYKQAACAFHRNVNFRIFSDMDIFEILFGDTIIGLPLRIFDKLNVQVQKDLKKKLLMQLAEAVRAVEENICESYNAVKKLQEDLKRGQRGENA